MKGIRNFKQICKIEGEYIYDEKSKSSHADRDPVVYPVRRLSDR
jgi:hypothetical protein